MTDKQPEALRLADAIERYNAGVHSQAIHEDYQRAVNELLRLDEVNKDLFEPLEKCKHEAGIPGNVWKIARAAITKATGDTK